MNRSSSFTAVFAIREFQSLWLSQVLSLLGDQLALVALTTLVFQRTSSPFLAATTYAVGMLAPVVGGPLLAGLADRYPRREVMIAGDIARAIIIGLISLPGPPVMLLVALIFIAEVLGSPFSAARAALMADILTGDRYILGSAITSITNQASQLVGFAAGGLLVALVGNHWALVIDSATFAASAGFTRWGIRFRPADTTDRSRSLLSGTRQATQLIWRNRWLRGLVSLGWLSAIYAVPEGLVTPYAANFGGGAATVGFLLAANPAGTVLGSLIVSRFLQPSARLRSMGWLAVAACVPLLMCGYPAELWVTLGLWALSGIGGAYNIAANAAFVTAVPSELRGQAFGIAQSGILVGQGLAIIIAGACAQVMPPSAVVALAGGIGIILALFISLTLLRPIPVTAGK
jgi:MFS family permease